MSQSLIKNCHIYYDNVKPDFCVICVPGRGQDGSNFARAYHEVAGFKNTVFVGPTPHGYAWYPMPFSATDQTRALLGLPIARNAINAVADAISKKFDLPRSKMAILGFSAGGVMAIETASHSEEPFALVASHAGAILEPKNLPYCQCPDTPVILTHNRDDECFEWYERYVPMKTALKNQGYQTLTLERRFGGHRVLPQDMEQVILYLAQYLIPQHEGWEKEHHCEWRQEDLILE